MGGKCRVFLVIFFQFIIIRLDQRLAETPAEIFLVVIVSVLSSQRKMNIKVRIQLILPLLLRLNQILVYCYKDLFCIPMLKSHKNSLLFQFSKTPQHCCAVLVVKLESINCVIITIDCQWSGGGVLL